MKSTFAFADSRAKQVESRIHDQAAQIISDKIHRGPHRRAEGLARALAIRRLVFKEPGQRLHRIVLWPLDGIRAIMQALRHRSAQQDRRLALGPGSSPHTHPSCQDFLHPAQHPVFQVHRFKHTARPLLLVRAMMRHPLLTENLKAELRPFKVPGRGSAGKSMRRRADADHRLARIQIARTAQAELRGAGGSACR